MCLAKSSRLRINLTLTSVVFEFELSLEKGISIANLTLTSVVFEF